eukprot:gene4277-biopygen13019
MMISRHEWVLRKGFHDLGSVSSWARGPWEGAAPSPLTTRADSLEAGREFLPAEGRFRQPHPPSASALFVGLLCHYAAVRCAPLLPGQRPGAPGAGQAPAMTSKYRKSFGRHLAGIWPAFGRHLAGIGLRRWLAQ